MNDLLIIQFAKWPVLGCVKTRLASSVGDAKALQVHMVLMEEVLDKLLNEQQGVVELWLNEIPEQQVTMATIIHKTKVNNIACKIQCGDSLGDKMADAMTISLKDFKKVIIVGSDCPNISAATLKLASKALGQTDLVIGPAEDGGYVLIGASRFEKALFTGVAWGRGRYLIKQSKMLSN